MLIIKNINTLQGRVEQIEIPSEEEYTLDGQGRLLMLPAMVDPAIHFEDWRIGAREAIAGGVTTVLETPDHCNSSETLFEKKKQIEEELAEAKIPLHHHIFIEAHPDYLEEIPTFLPQIIGIKITDLLFSYPEAWDRVFQLAAQENLILVMQITTTERKGAFKAMQKSVEMVQKYDTQLLLLDVKTKEEVNLISETRKGESIIFGEVHPQTLMQENQKGETDDQKALWKGIKEETLELIGSGSCPEIMLPLLLQAYSEKRLTLEEIVNLTRKNSEMVFRLERRPEEFVIVDLEKKQKITRVSNNQWSSYIGRELQGWPLFTVLNGKVYKNNN